MIDAKTAVKSAMQFFSELFPTAQDVRLEEVEMSDMGKWWNITLSYLHPPASQLEAVIGSQTRIYKLIEVWWESGEVRSVKIRKV